MHDRKLEEEVESKEDFDLKVFGDIVLFEVDDLEGKLLQIFTPQPVHSAIQTGEHTAESMNLTGNLYHDLTYPKGCYANYVILEHKDITPVKRQALMRLHSELSTDYDFLLISKLAIRKIKGMQPDFEDLSTKDKYGCSSRLAEMYERIGLPIIKGVHSSQVESYMFLKSYFNITKEWVRK